MNQIQQAILEMSGGEFQKLADAYLIEKGFKHINPIGSVVAANKARAGTPDSLFTTSDRKYIFAEYTTQHANLLSKLKGDLDKCLDESKTSIPLDKIERVIFCYTGKLNAEEVDELARICQEKGINLDLFGIESIALELYHEYPGLARDFLGIEIDTGQIVPPKKFISLYNNTFAIPLDLSFHFREEELDRILKALEKEKLVILTGQAGVGKTRLALEASQRFRETHPDYDVLCIFGRHRDLWEDIQVYFRKSGSFLILVDDANRVSRFEYVVDLLLHQREDQQIKVIATVRDYALSKIREEARTLEGFEARLEPFPDEQLKELITNEYGIRNYLYLNRIADIAHGNPRLAVMAAEVVKKKDSLSSIHDASSLYDAYFSSIREDLSKAGADFKDTKLLKVAAVVSFFKAIDCANDEMMSDVENAFNLSPAVFWEASDRLHDLEIVDIYEDEVVRMSDQVLGTYLFYLATFKKGVLDFGALLKHFFPRLKHRLIDSINPVLSAFDSERIIDAMRPHVEQVWMELREAEDEAGLLHLLDVFWFTKRTDILLWVREQIRKLKHEPVEITRISFEKSSEAIPSPSILSILRKFAFVREDEVKIALELLLDYMAKCPSKIPLILRILIDDYGFRLESYLRKFEVQRAVLDMLWSRAENGDPPFLRVFLAIASNHLGTHFENESQDARMILFTRFDVPFTPELASMRAFIWEQLFTLYRNQHLGEEILNVIHNYSTSSLRVTNSDVVRADAKHVLPFLKSVLNPDDYRHCVVMHNYLDLLEKNGVEAPMDLRDRFNNETYRLSEILLSEWGEQRDLELSYEEHEDYRRKRLEKYTEGYTLDDYTRFFAHCLEIKNVLQAGHKEYPLQQSVTNALLLLADRNPDLYVEVLKYYLSFGDPFRIPGYAPVQKLVKHLGYDEALQLLSKVEFQAKQRWLFHLYETLPDDAVNEEQLSHLYDLYRTADIENLPYHLDFLLKYLSLDSQVVARVVSMVLQKAEKEPNAAYALGMLFHTKVAKRLPDLFANDIDLLKQAYLLVEGTRQHSDHDGKVFNLLLDLDPAFIAEYITWKYSNVEHGWLNSHDDHRDYTFIWRRPDYQDVMDKVIDLICRPERDFVHTSYLGTFFRVRKGDSKTTNEVLEKQYPYLLRLIDERNSDLKLMKNLFLVISQFAPERRRQFVERFVQRNKDFEAFKRLQLDPRILSWYGSAVPVLQKCLNYWESLLPLMGTANLLQHKQYIEQHIRKLRSQIESEKKKDFIGY